MAKLPLSSLSCNINGISAYFTLELLTKQHFFIQEGENFAAFIKMVCLADDIGNVIRVDWWSVSDKNEFWNGMRPVMATL